MQPMKTKAPLRSLIFRASKTWISGFSLVEVTIATGIAAFGIITLLGLLPSGMKMFRDAMNVTVSAQIAQRLIKEAVQTDYDTLVEVIGTGVPAAGVPIIKDIRYFTDEGVELPSDRKDESVFHAHTRVLPSTNLPSSSGLLGNNSLATITVQIAVNPSNETLPIVGGSGNPLSGTISPTSRIPFVTYTGHIAKNK
jgi:uncharacterized protein (TIGR02598 family)